MWHNRRIAGIVHRGGSISGPLLRGARFRVDFVARGALFGVLRLLVNSVVAVFPSVVSCVSAIRLVPAGWVDRVDLVEVSALAGEVLKVGSSLEDARIAALRLVPVRRVASRNL